MSTQHWRCVNISESKPADIALRVAADKHCVRGGRPCEGAKFRSRWWLFECEWHGTPGECDNFIPGSVF